MTEPAPRYVVTFRPRTPEMVAVAVFTVLGAGFVVAVATVARAFDCDAEDWSQCSPKGLAQLLIAYASFLLALGTLVESLRRRGHPRKLFLATLAVVTFWGLLLLSWA